MSGELNGKVAIVTGGAAGMGRVIAERFLAEGASVVLGDIDRDRGEEAASALGPDVAFSHVDMGQPDQVEALVTFANERFGTPRILVNNAGIVGAQHGSFFDDDFADFHTVMDVNLLGVMVATREAAKRMAEGAGGAIVNIASTSGLQYAPNLWAYHLSKAGVIHFTKCSAVALGEHKIRVNCIAPGSIRTPLLKQTMTAHLSGAEASEAVHRIREYMHAQQAIPEQGTPEDIAEAAVYLASDRSQFVTGTVLAVDGGLAVAASGRDVIAAAKLVSNDQHRGDRYHAK